MHDFISKYLLYNSGNMAPKRHHQWSAISILAMTMGRKVFVDHQYYRVYPTMYICLVGRQGIRKGTAKDLASEMFIECFPTYPLGASVMSREKIVEQLAHSDTCRTYTDENAELIEFRPMAFFVNELKNFMSVNPQGMIEFLTDIYDRKFFNAGTIKHGMQTILHPCINILACETPDWIIDKLKLKIISGGFSRRMLYVYETEQAPRITFPYLSPEAQEARAWCCKHLEKISTLAGGFTWKDQATRDYFDEWFKALPVPDDTVMAGFYEAKDVLAQKVAMMLAVAQDDPKLVFTIELLETAIAFLESIEENLPKLSIAVGRNELALPQQQLLEYMRKHGGMIREYQLRIVTQNDMSPMEFGTILRHLEDTRQVFRKTYTTGDKDEMRLVLPETLAAQVEAGLVKIK